MLKQLIVGATAVAASFVPFSGVASASEAGPHDDPDGYDQVGLLNLNNTDVLHNVNAVIGVCDNNISVLGGQISIEEALNGVGVPILSPGEHEAVGMAPENCASGDLMDGGTVQDN